MLSVDNITFNYGGTPVFRDVSFQVDSGSLCALFGPNGTGKTTLFKCCLNFLKISRGAIAIGATPVHGRQAGQLARLVAYVPQEHRLSFPYTVREIVLMGRTPHLGGSFGIRETDKIQVLDALRLLGILHLSGRRYNELSGGQRQLVLLARALAQQTPLLLLDEPTASLDFDNQLLIWKVLKQLSRQGKAILVGTHDPNHVLWFCDQVIVLGNKGVIAAGPPADSLNEKVLGRIYSSECRVVDVGKLQVVLPSSTDGTR